MKLPPPLEAELKKLGVILTEQDVVEKPKVERDYKFRRPNLDENGEPDF
jgi:hypothetical protein